MEFKKEYKDAVKIISPDENAVKRMKASVLEKAAKEKHTGKAVLLKRAALIGGSAAACFIVTVSAVLIMSGISEPNMVSEASSANIDMECLSVTNEETSDNAAPKSPEFAAGAGYSVKFDDNAEEGKTEITGNNIDSEADGIISEAAAEDTYCEETDCGNSGNNGQSFVCETGAYGETWDYETYSATEPEKTNPCTGGVFYENITFGEGMNTCVFMERSYNKISDEAPENKESAAYETLYANDSETGSAYMVIKYDDGLLYIKDLKYEEDVGTFEEIKR